MHRYCALVLRSPDPAVERVPCGPTPRNTAIGPDAEIRGRGKITGRATRRSPLHGSCRSGLSETGYWIVEPAAATGSGMPCVNGRRAYPFSMLNFVTSKSLTSAVVDGVLKTPSLGQRSSMRYGRLLRG